MSNDFPNRNENYDYTTEPYKGDPWAEQQALGERKNGCGGNCLTGCGCGCLILILALIIGGFLVHRICIKGVPLEVSPETTVITEPLKTDGKTVDYFPVLVKTTEPDIPVGENGFRAVVEAYGKVIFEPQFGPRRDWQYEETCKKFGLDPELKPTCVYEDPTDYLVVDKEADKPTEEKPAEPAEEAMEDEERDEADDVVSEENELLDSERLHLSFDASPLEQFVSTPWTLDEQPKMKEWLEKVGPGLDIVQQSALKEHYFLPMIRRNEKELCLLSVSMDATNFHSRLVRGLRVRAMNRFASGETEAGWKDILASLRIYRQIVVGNDFIASMEGNVVNTRLDRNLSEMLIRYDRWTPEQLSRCIDDLETLPKWPPDKELMQAVLFMLLDAASSAGDMRSLLESVSPEPVDEDTVRLMQSVGFNWNLVARKLIAQFDELERKIDGKSFEEVKELFGEDLQTQIEMEMHAKFAGMGGEAVLGLLTVDGRSELMGEIIGMTMTLTTGRFLVEEIDETIQCRLLRTGLALERYKLEKKEYPEALEALELKESEPAVPIKYEKTAAGYVLSAGGFTLEKEPTEKKTEQ